MIFPPFGSALTDRFREIGLTAEHIRHSTQPHDDLRGPLVPTRRTEICDDADAVLVRAFFCGVPAEGGVLAAALGGDLFRACCDAGLLVDSDGGWTSPFHVRPVRNLYLWSDYLGPDADPDAVMGAGETTAVLYRAACPRQRLPSSLDLGCGAGTLALLLAGIVDRVVGTDVNPRAVSMAKVNAALNGIENVEFRTGSIYDPVSADRFDLIVSQPPYYPDPAGGGTQVYLHGGPRGDELAWAIVAGAPDHLCPGGRALVFTSWPADRVTPSSPEIRVLELATNRRELNGTRQSISVIQHAAEGEGWTARFEVSAECWGDVDPDGIDEIIAAEELARGPEELMLGSRLRLTHGAEFLSEGTDICLRTASRALIGNVPVSAEVEADLRAIDGAVNAGRAGVPAERVRGYLRRGMLRVACAASFSDAAHAQRRTTP